MIAADVADLRRWLKEVRPEFPAFVLENAQPQRIQTIAEETMARLFPEPQRPRHA